MIPGNALLVAVCSVPLPGRRPGAAMGAAIGAAAGAFGGVATTPPPYGFYYGYPGYYGYYPY